MYARYDRNKIAGGMNARNAIPGTSLVIVTAMRARLELMSVARVLSRMTSPSPGRRNEPETR